MRSLEIPVNRNTVDENLENHPEYPSLLSIIDCLTEWKVNHKAFHIQKDEYNSTNLHFPFLAHFHEKGGRFVLVHAIQDQKVLITDEVNNKSHIAELEFLERWDGIVLHAEKNSSSGEQDYHKKRFEFLLKDLTLPLCFTSMLIIFGSLIAMKEPFLEYLSIGTLKLFGIAATILLLLQSLNSDNPFIRNLCGLSGKDDCNAILKSDAAKLTDWLSWSEVGFFYFAGTFLSVLLTSTLWFTFWLNVLALPYTIYSLNYQFRLKKWCVLCCSVQGLLILEFLVGLGFGSFRFPDNVSINEIGIISLCFLIPVLCWAFLKPFFLSSVRLKSLKNQLNLFKYDQALFHQALTNQPRYAVTEELMPITLGNPNAENVITMVSNPFCGPCAKAHKTLNDWLQVREDFRLNVIFSLNDNDQDRTNVATHLTALGRSKVSGQVGEIIREWYESEKKSKDFMRKYPLETDQKVLQAIENQKQWCSMAEIQFTPTIFINGYQLPEIYMIEDIKYLLG
ncbi:cysteine peptidase family C39 domain-containing protein [Pedobacter psychrotolerans]|uniref:cysteine peptidase family C39 domain-containing protein n=1 Tax=Pedobacter psychrotolerans TaxID=1843235 RepID=UPI0014052C22|nr:cysteine peptidase family C39 domain-containing protein [Pedobacter psychrotolerans]